MQQVHLPPDPLRGQRIQDKEIREGGRLLRIPVHDPRRPGVQVGQLKPGVAFLRVDLPELGELVPRHQQVHVVVPGDKALVAHAAQQGSAHQVVFNAVPVADRGDIPQLLQQFLVDLLQRQYAII